MSRKKIVLTAYWPQSVVAAMEENYTVIAPKEGEKLAGDDLIHALKDADAIAPLFYDKLDKDFIDALPQGFSLIAGFGIGTDHIDINAANKRGIAVSNTPDVVTIDTADLAIGLMIAASRRFYEREKAIRDGTWGELALMAGLGGRITGKTLGIVGMGRIGQAVAKRAQAFDMKVIYTSRTRKPELEESLGLHYIADLNQLLSEADIISLHAALTPDTHHMIDKDSFAAMKPTAVLINTGRGGLVDEKAMVTALKEMQIMAAGIDVYEYEPKLAAGLAELDNATLLPHIGTATYETREAMGMRVKENIDHFFKTGVALDPVK